MKNLKLLPLLSMFLLVLLGSCGDECDDVNCQNGATCDDGTCICTAGFEGNECQTETRAKFFGAYNVSENCNFGNDSYQFTVTTSGAGPTNIIFTNFFNVGASVSGTVSGNSVTIPNQTVNAGGQSYTFNGSGQLAGNQLTIQFTVSIGTESGTCTATCVKQ